MTVLRCLGHDGLAESGVTNSIDRALILSSTGDDVPPPKRVVTNTGKKTRVFEVNRVSFFQLKAIDPVSQSFHAHVYFEFVVHGAAEDADLMETGDAFSYPYPPLAWFWMQQLDFSNSIAHEIKEQKIIPAPKGPDGKPSPDMLCIVRVCTAGFEPTIARWSATRRSDVQALSRTGGRHLLGAV